jgi:hypothetical protein
MATRIFTDERGVQWTVWAVYPAWVDRRVGQDRRLRGDPDRGRIEVNRRTGTVRRRGLPDSGPRVRMAPNMSAGWLAFESGTERRRVSPIPPGWEEASDSELAGLCAKANPAVVRPRKLLE